MKYFAILLMGLFHARYSHATSIFPQVNIYIEPVNVRIPGTTSQSNLAGYVKAKPSDLRKWSGKKLKWKELIYSRMNQKQIRKHILKDSSIDMLAFGRSTEEPFKFHLGGFLLGILVPVGFIITLFFKDKKRKNRTISALMGMAIALGIGIIIGGLIAASNI